MEVDVGRSTFMGASIGIFHGSKHRVSGLLWRLAEAPMGGDSMKAYTPSMEVTKKSMELMFLC